MDINLILIFILVVVILYVILKVVTRPDGVTGLLDAKIPVIVSNNDMSIYENDEDIYNHSYSIWTYIKDWTYNYGAKKMIFEKEGLEVFFTPTQNDLSVKVSTYDQSDAEMTTIPFECGISNIPVQKWINIIVSLNNKNMDIYINGKLAKTCVMSNVRQSFTSNGITLTNNNGFSGYTSKFNYLKQPIDPQTAWNIYKKGWDESNILSLNFGYDVDVVVTKNGESVF